MDTSIIKVNTFGTQLNNRHNMKRILLLTITLAFTALLLSSCNLVDNITGSDDSVDLYPVRIDGEWGYIDKEGKIVLEPEFQNAGDFKNGMAPVRHSWGWKYINKKGEIKVEGNFSNIRPFSGDKAAVQFEGRWGYINKSGSFVINPKFRSASDFSDGRAFVRSINYSSYYYIDENGSRIEAVGLPSDMDYVEESEFRNGRAMVRDGDMYGYIDKSGNTVIELKYPEARPFNDQLAAVRVSDRWGFIDSKGQVEISPQFISVGDFGNGLAPARVNTNSFGYIDKSGQVVIEEQYQQAGTFNEDRAPVLINDKWTFIDKSGNQITSPKFDEVEPFYNGLARVTIYVPVEDEIEENYGYINKAGKYVWFPTR